MKPSHAATHLESAVALFDRSELASELTELVDGLLARRVSAVVRVRRSGGVVEGKTSRESAAAESVSRATVAFERGFSTWEQFVDALTVQDLSYVAIERQTVLAAMEGNRARVDTLLKVHPDLPQTSRAVGLCMGYPSAADGLDRISVNRGIGPLRCEPLVYLCCSRYGNDDPSIVENRIAIAEKLISLEADPNVGMFEHDSLRGFRTSLGGAVACVRSARLVDILIDAGFDINDGPTLYEGSAIWEATRLCDHALLQKILDAEPPVWHPSHALPHSLIHNDEEMVEALLKGNGDPNWNMAPWCFGGTALHEAVVLGCSDTIVKLLIEYGANVEATDRDGRTPLAMATALNRDSAADVLKSHGSDEQSVRHVDRWVSACFAQDAAEASRLDRTQPVASLLLPTDHLWVCRAARLGSSETIRLLIDGGASANAVDDDAQSALHLAAMNHDVDSVRVLLDHGADATRLNFENLTPLDCALATTADLGSGIDEVVSLLVERTGWEIVGANAYAFSLDVADALERAADAVAKGDEETLKTLIADVPSLTVVRSRRPHRCCLINYVGVNGFEGERQVTPKNAVAITKILLSAGCDPNALSFTYRGGPGNNTMGLLTSSGVPKQVGLMLPLVKALAEAGAEVSGSYGSLVRLSASVETGDVGSFFENFAAESRDSVAMLVDAASLGERELLSLLIEHGVDVNGTTYGGVRAIHNAALDGDEETVRLLLEAGADPRLREDTYNGTAAGWADAGGHRELTKFLVEEIVKLNDGQPLREL